MLKYKRVLLKLSGEALAGEKGFGINMEKITEVCRVVKRCVEAGAEIGIVVGAGNFWRGAKDGAGIVERTRADYMGMLATTMNALAIGDALTKIGVKNAVQTAIEMRQVAEPYVRETAVRHLENGEVVVFGCGTGCPFFSTDTGAILRGCEIAADIVLMAKNIDGIYDSDPRKNPEAKRYDLLTYDEILQKDLKAIDAAAAALARDNQMPCYAFALSDPENIYRVISGEDVGTLIR